MSFETVEGTLNSSNPDGKRGLRQEALTQPFTKRTGKRAEELIIVNDKNTRA